MMDGWRWCDKLAVGRLRSRLESFSPERAMTSRSVSSPLLDLRTDALITVSDYNNAPVRSNDFSFSDHCVLFVFSFLLVFISFFIFLASRVSDHCF